MTEYQLALIEADACHCPDGYKGRGLTAPDCRHEDILALVAEVRRLRAENARLDAILWALNEHTPTIVDDEFGFRLLGRGCEHPSLTGDRCDACGWTQAWEADRG